MKKILSILLFCFSFSIAFTQSNFYDINSIRQIRLYFEESNWDHVLDSLFQTGDGSGRLIGKVWIDGLLYDSVGVRYKGYSSWNVDSIKNPFNIKLDHIKESQDHMGHNKLKLSNVIHDPSFVREALSYQILRNYMPASCANYANVYVNDVLLGLYTNVEAVNKDFVEKHFGSRDNSFFKGNPEHLEIPFGNNSNLSNAHGTDTSDYFPYYDIKSEYGWTDLYEFINILNTEPDSIEKRLNVDRTLWMHAFNYSLLNLDSYIGYAQNYYLYRDDNGVFNPIIWDLNMSFGSFRNTDGILPTNLSIAYLGTLDPIQHQFSTNRPLLSSLLQNDTYKRMYLAHIRTISNEFFETNLYYDMGEIIQNIIDNDVFNDPNRFYSYNAFLENYDTTSLCGSLTYPGIRSLINARKNYLSTYPGIQNAPTVDSIYFSHLNVTVGDTLWIIVQTSNADSVIIGYRENSFGRFIKTALFDDGNHHDGILGDGIYAGFLVVERDLQYFIYAENTEAGIFKPERAEYEYYNIGVTGDIVINEFLADNKDIQMDPNDQYDDWIEIYNKANSSVNLSGYFLSDEIGNRSKWSFPDTLLMPNSYLIVWCDKDTNQYGMHSNFNISASGGVLILSDSDTNLIDKVEYNYQLENISLGRYPNGSGPYQSMYPSFKSVNDNVLLIDNRTTENSVSLYPNPASDLLYIEIDDNFKSNYVEIYSLYGRKVYTEVFESKILMVDVSTIVRGAYLVRVNNKDSYKLILR